MLTEYPMSNFRSTPSSAEHSHRRMIGITLSINMMSSLRASDLILPCGSLQRGTRITEGKVVLILVEAGFRQPACYGFLAAFNPKGDAFQSPG